MDGEMPYISRIKDTSIREFGFFTNRPSRGREYSWVLEQMSGKAGFACDVGAGTSPVPIILAEEGWFVDTIDYWNEDTQDEWGFINYAHISDRCRSENVDFTKYDSDTVYDVVYSISAIEHMTRDVRSQVFFRAYDLLVAGGRFLATVDITQSTNLIHNRNYGKRIEDDHGTVETLLSELLLLYDVVVHHRESFKGQGQDVLFIEALK